MGLASMVGRRAFKLGSLSPMARLQIVMRAPSVLKLSLALFKDPRVPASSKVLLGGAVVLILSPIDLPNWVPMLGQAADIFFLINVLDKFITTAPRAIVQEHIARLGLQGKISL